MKDFQKKKKRGAHEGTFKSPNTNFYLHSYRSYLFLITRFEKESIQESSAI